MGNERFSWTRSTKDWIMICTLLDSDWRFMRSQPSPIFHRPQIRREEAWPADVPGHVHLDLVRAGVIADPFQRQYELSANWVDDCDWTYVTSFVWHPKAEVPLRTLVFEGLDTICKVFLNDREIAESDNMFIPLSVDVTESLIDGENRLRLEFQSAVRVGTERRTAYFEKYNLTQDYLYFDERAFVRKAGYMTGWDWGPVLVSMGIWKPIRLEEFSSKIVDLSVKVKREASGSYLVEANVETIGPEVATLSIVLGSADTQLEVVSQTKDYIQWRLIGGEWWPRGMGDQILHEVIAEVPSGHRVSKKVGLRTIELKREPDEFGESFVFYVNGNELWARGANWIPDNSFPSIVSGEQYRRQVETFANLEMNMLRVWGGGLYESEEFYDACDELGLLVWQDFPFACMYYPDDAEWQERVRQEAIVNVKRIAHRASLCLWCGNNENLAMYQGKWRGIGTQPDRYYGEDIYDKVLPSVVSEYDGVTPYIASSPIGISPDESIPIGSDRNVGMGGYGDAHYWDVWHGRGDWIHYADSTTRFSSEFGFASSPSMLTWRSVLSDEELKTFPNSAVLHHDKTGKPWDTFLGYVTKHYPEPATLEDWMYYSQLNQRDALRFGIEYFRRSKFCKGSLIWQANDCWPVTSWAIQDSSFMIKPAGFELRRLYSDVLTSIEHIAGQDSFDIWLANCGTQDVATTINVDVIDCQTGEVRQSTPIPCKAAAGSVENAITIYFHGFDLKRTVVRVSSLICDERWLWIAEPKEMKWLKPKITVTLDEGLSISVSGFAPDMVVWDPDLPKNVTDCVSGLPGLNTTSVANASVRYQVESPPKRLVVRTLAGTHSLVQTKSGTFEEAN